MLPDEIVGVLEDLVGGSSRFRSLSTTLSPNETVFRRFDAVPGVTRILFVGEAMAFTAESTSIIVTLGASLALPVARGFRKSSAPRRGLADRLFGFCSRWTFSSSSAPGVPKRALLKARIAKTGAGVSGGSDTFEPSVENKHGKNKYKSARDGRNRVV